MKATYIILTGLQQVLPELVSQTLQKLIALLVLKQRKRALN